jgi:hypothetical protein
MAPIAFALDCFNKHNVQNIKYEAAKAHTINLDVAVLQQHQLFWLCIHHICHW